jgi:hypothetical protein
LYYLYSKLKVDPFNGDPIIHYVVDIKTEVFPVNAAGNAATKAVQANFAGQFVIPDAPRGDLRLRAAGLDRFLDEQQRRQLAQPGQRRRDGNPIGFPATDQCPLP